MCAIQLLKMNECENEKRDIYLHNIHMKDMETLDSKCDNNINISNIIVNDIGENESDLTEININIKDNKWKFECSKYVLENMLMFGSDLSVSFIQVLVEIVFKSIC